MASTTACSSGRVFRCFKWLERLGDRVTGAAGPVFVTLAVVMIGTGVVCFFDVIQPGLPFRWLTTPLCLLIVFNLFMHYYYVCTVSPGFIDDPPHTPKSGLMWARKRKSAARSKPLTGVRWSDGTTITKATMSKCNKCATWRPERAHHCRICKKCVLKYDHHCPCVGLHNERHFVLFLLYLVVASYCFVAFGWTYVLTALGWFDIPWLHRSPPIAFLLIYILSAVLGLAVTVMAAWHLWGIACAETSVEAQDHEHYRKVAKGRGEDFVNSYDLGKRKNLELFFNVGKDGYPLWTLLFPFRVEPYTDGHSWARTQGLERHKGVRIGEELTDEEEEY
ncbi:DHHC palmitoyltransferase-domain-containing protein [Cristinia sonorae]|uniref:Palmitoyltransferase n=1 Tax=Cristinia sonorae TaxID=1940300 RepID=A0A8K0UCN7_9AGAR|nr:DHHC palmitoyltransferase-domain-containing protein [Cristinia sonorae]